MFKENTFYFWLVVVMDFQWETQEHPLKKETYPTLMMILINTFLSIGMLNKQLEVFQYLKSEIFQDKGL